MSYNKEELLKMSGALKHWNKASDAEKKSLARDKAEGRKPRLRRKSKPKITRFPRGHRKKCQKIEFKKRHTPEDEAIVLAEYALIKAKKSNKSAKYKRLCVAYVEHFKLTPEKLKKEANEREDELRRRNARLRELENEFNLKMIQ